MNNAQTNKVYNKLEKLNKIIRESSNYLDNSMNYISRVQDEYFEGMISGREMKRLIDKIEANEKKARKNIEVAEREKRKIYMQINK